ncbi:MAG: DinB family protein [Saprospiraceae bacterium]|nr:DinB family protein [Saprospiraceae bacterium]
MAKTPRPAQDEYASFYQGYVARVPDVDLVQYLTAQQGAFVQLLSAIPPAREAFRYAEGKWTIKQLVQHVIDSERVFAYRVLAFARGEQQPLPGFEENDYAAAATAAHRQLEDLILEFGAVRSATIQLLRSLEDADYDKRGTASGAGVTVRALAFIIAGHCAHHMAILRERYGA